MSYNLETLLTEFRKVKTAWDILSDLRITPRIIGIGIYGSTSRVLSTKLSKDDKGKKVVKTIIKPWVEHQFKNEVPWDDGFKEHHRKCVQELKTILNDNNVHYARRHIESIPWSVCAKFLDLILLYGINHKASLRQYFHVNGNLPLDSYSIHGLKEIFKDLKYDPSTKVKDFLDSKDKFSMGSIAKHCKYIEQDEIQLYDQIQNEIRVFISTLHISEFYPFHFDRWAWQNELLNDKGS